MNRQDKYVITISKIDVIRAFRSASTLDAFITAQFNSLYTGAEYDEYIHMKQLFAELITEGVAAETAAAGATVFTYETPKIDGTVDGDLSGFVLEE